MAEPSSAVLAEALFEGALLSPDAQLAASLEKIAAGAQALRAAAQPTLAAWWRVSPLISFMEDVQPALRLQPLEADLLRWLGHLENVCQAPRLELRSQTERVPVSRARRVSLHAPTFLAAHPEDWEARTLRGVRPRRVLSLLPEDELDLYENRVVARLIDHLLRHLRRRLEELAVLTQYYDQYQQLDRGSHWRAKRIYTLWGKDLEEQQHRAAATELRAQLQGLCQRLQHLQDSALYRAVPRSAAVGHTLRVTNILAHDPEYRFVVRLWQSMRRARSEETPAQRRQRLREIDERFRGYTQVLVLRALENLCVATSDQQPLRLAVGREEQIATYYGSIVLRLEEDGSLRLRGAERAALRLVPCPAALAADPQRWEAQGACVQAALEHLRSAGTVVPGPRGSQRRAAQPVMPEPRADALVLLYPAATAKQWEALPAGAQARLAWQGDWLWPAPEPWRLVPVSPLQLDSVERVSRVLLGWLLTPLLLGEQEAALRRCVVCHTTGPQVQRLAVGMECKGCLARWGSYRCSGCGERFPFLRPGANPFQGPPARIDYVDAALGRDALALPCPGAADLAIFVCPRCGVCPRRDQRQDSCVRCRLSAAAQQEVKR